MKLVLTSIVFLLISNYFLSQGICYFYDAAGNRTSQSTECPGLPPPIDDESTADDNDKSLSETELELLSKVYPNPSYGIVNVELPENEIDGKKDKLVKNFCVVQVMDESGRIVLSEKYEDNMFQLDLTRNAIGRYVVKLSFNGIEESWQVIKN